MRGFRLLVILAFSAIVCTSAALPVRAQVLPSLPKASPAPSVPGLRQEGLFYTAPVIIDGAGVFRLASPVTPQGSELPINVRLLYVENAISQILTIRQNGDTAYDPKSFMIGIDRVDQQQTLVATDARHGESEEVPVLTVTSADAQFANQPAEALAKQWQPLLQSALQQALQKRQPQQIRRNIDALTRLVIALILLTIVAFFVWRSLKRRASEIHERVEEQQQRAEEEEILAAHDPSDAVHQRVLSHALEISEPEQQLQRLNAVAGALVWLIVVLWALAITWALFQFPQTVAWGQSIRRRTIAIAFIWVIAGLMNKVGDIVIVRAAAVYSKRGQSSEGRARHVLRAPTIARTLGGFKVYLILFIAALATLSRLDISVASVVTIGGVGALAIGFAAQSLVRDLLNGMLALFEDQYVVGDYVMVGEYNGIVEKLTLRMVQLRDTRGNLITIPHSNISQVVNASRDWSRIDFRIPVDSKADLAKAIEVLRVTIEAFAREPAWRSAFLTPVEWIGVEAPSKNGIVLRASIRTAPLRQFEINRHLNERVLERFRREGIELGADPLTPPVPSVTASPNPF